MWKDEILMPPVIEKIINTNWEIFWGEDACKKSIELLYRPTGENVNYYECPLNDFTCHGVHQYIKKILMLVYRINDINGKLNPPL